jgi:hypothetical protein
VLAHFSKSNPEAVENHCAKRLARTNGAISEAWDFPKLNRTAEPGISRLTFIVDVGDYADGHTVELCCTATGLDRLVPLERMGDTPWWAVDVLASDGEVHRYQFRIDGSWTTDPINPFTLQDASGVEWSRCFTNNCHQILTFERWEVEILDRLTRYIMFFRSPEAQKLGTDLANGYRFNAEVGMVSYIDKALARHESHRLVDYKICLSIIDSVLRTRVPTLEPELVPDSVIATLYDQMSASDGKANTQSFPDWDYTKYSNPRFFLKLLRRHAFSGAFCDPSWGGNSQGMGWSVLQALYQREDGQTAFDWRRTRPAPLGTASDYAG